MATCTKEGLEKILYKDFILNPHCFLPGHRNEDAVDMCCVAWCLDKDPMNVLQEISDEQHWSHHEFDAAKEHVDRITSYLPKWGPRGTMAVLEKSFSY